ncbi:transcription repressor [Rhynchospora pubera]|uniref:Transcription repressor n=1 Tax=Rhynchospora pubera TaxID=906938 RepID=A0AAV8FSE6_9POAL|nr:transcription repressor [Rhynchospora pubera]
MGKNKFRLCDLMSNSWLYKLSDMAKPRRIRNNSKTSKKSEEDIYKLPELEISAPFPPNLQNYVPNRASQYLPSKERLNALCQTPSRPIKLKHKPKQKPTSPVSIHRKSSHDDIVFELGPTSPELKLRPILTKPRSRASKLKVKSISPRCNSRTKQRRWISESYLVMKYTTNAEKDFMESMVEMIVEKNIIRLKDLEELLACYLSLNSREYQDVIVKAFEKIWFVLFETNYIC